MNRSDTGGASLLAPLIVLTGIAAAWVFLLSGAGTGMNIQAMSTLRFPPPQMPQPMSGNPMMERWDIGYTVSMLAMWWIMMIAMMLPGIAEKSWRAQTIGTANRPGIAAVRYCLGYALPWLAFSIAATAVQYSLERVGLLNGMMMWSISSELSAVILLVVGLYQASPIKARALMRCRAGHTANDPLTSGMEEAVRCLANSTPLMLLLFVGGAMNLAWIVALTAINMFERHLPNPRLISTCVGAVCVLAAVYLLIQAR